MEAIPDLQDLALETVRSPRLRVSSYFLTKNTQTDNSQTIAAMVASFFANNNVQVRDHGLEMTFEQKGLANFRFFGGKLPRAYLTSFGDGYGVLPLLQV